MGGKGKEELVPPEGITPLTVVGVVRGVDVTRGRSMWLHKGRVGREGVPRLRTEVLVGLLPMVDG